MKDFADERNYACSIYAPNYTCSNYASNMHQTMHVQFKEKTLKWQLIKGADTGFGY